MKLLQLLKRNVVLRRTHHMLDHKQEVLIKQGREQFRSLIRKGLQVPVVLL
ncbi:MAG: hypothetical protein HY429_01160 [Candidatus Levybacteria bacterium]|nr:hypothetical protein [Candidatus Levybacteria bacterium]